MKLSLLFALITTVASAAPFTGGSLSFDGLIPGEQVLNYYDGGAGSLGSGPGPALGVSFSSGLVADSTQFAFGPSARVAGSLVTMNLSNPWSRSVGFYFTGSGTLSFYSGVNNTGNLVSTYSLTYPPFFPFGESPGTFQSALFVPSSGSVLRLDSITFGALPVPEPSTFWLLSFVLVFLIDFRPLINQKKA